MNQIHQLISKINTSSHTILSELETEEPSFEIIVKELNNRETLIKEMNELEQSYSSAAFEPSELKSLRTQFNKFKQINETIQHKAENLLDLHQQKLAQATKARKAEQQYNISSKPNISYF